MQKYHNTVQETNGDIITTATVTVYLANTGTVATLYQDDEIATYSNPFTVLDGNYDTNGAIFFKANNGAYDIKIVNGANTTWLYDVSLYDIESSVEFYSNIAALRAITAIPSLTYATIKGYTTDGDGGGGDFYWDSSSTATDNGGTIIKATAITTGRWVRLYSGAVSFKWFGAKVDGITDDSIANQATVDALSANGGGTIRPSEGTSRFSTTLNMALGVNIIGGGWKAILEADDCDALSFGTLTAGTGNIVVRNFAINGVNGTTRRGIVHVGTDDSADELYGVTVSQLFITNFNIGIKYRTIRNGWIIDNWIQDVNSGIELVGKNLVIKIRGNQIVKAAGNGTGSSNGIFLDSHTYGTGGTISPEGIVIDSANQLFGFDIGLNVNSAIYVNFNDNDVAALIYGVSVSSVNAPMNIKNNYIAVTASAAIAGIWMKQQASVIDSSTTIESNHFEASATTSAIGIKVADSAAQNQTDITISSNSFYGFNTNDIAVYNSGDITIRTNRCLSTSPTNSIYVTGTLSNRVVYVDYDNIVAGVIAAGSTGAITYVGTLHGSFTPEAADAQTGGNVASGTIAGTFVAEGDMIHAVLTLGSIDTTGLTAGNQLWIRNLPFSVRAGSRAEGGVRLSNVIISSSPIFAANASTAGRITFNVSGGANAFLIVSDLTSTTATIVISVSYPRA